MIYRILKLLLFLWTIFCGFGGLGALYGLHMTSKLTESEISGAEAIGTIIGLKTWLIIWFLPTIGMGILVLFFKLTEKGQA